LSNERDEIFRKIFKILGLPALSVDIGHLVDFLDHQRSHEGANLQIPCNVGIQERRSALETSFAGLLSSLDVSDETVSTLAKINTVGSNEARLEIFHSLTKRVDKPYSIYSAGEILHWEETTPWPAA